ncbi:MAG: hypothetical protein PVH68_07640 [Armatimonadota bacterium]|jgi:hypothetical protein
MQDSTATSRTRGAVTARSMIIGLALIPVNIYWLMVMDVEKHVGVVTKMSMFYNSVGLLFALCLLTLLLRKFRPSLAFSGGELLVIYSIVTLGTAIGGIDMMEALVPTMAHAFWFATPENRWEEVVQPVLPRLLTVRDPGALRGIYEGGRSLYTPEAVLPWLWPGLIWCGFTVVLVWVMLCGNVIVRRRWIQDERLTFPLARLPIEMAAGQQALFKSRTLWYGFGIAAVIDLLGGLHELYPVVPYLEIRAYQGRTIFTGLPWSAVGRIELGFPPFIVGIGYLLPSAMLFSCVFFYIMTRLQLVSLAAAGGLDPRLPYLKEQTFGAYIGIAALVFWNGRGYWRQVWRRAVGRSSELSDEDEPLSYRVSLVGGAVGLIALIAFSVSAGMSAAFASIFFVLYFLICLALTRLRAELGPPAHDLPNASPVEIMALLPGTEGADRRSLAVNTLYRWFNRGNRNHPMPVQLEAFKMTEHEPAAGPRLAHGLTLAGAVSALATMWAILHIFYARGASTAKMRGESIGFGGGSYNMLYRWIEAPLGPDWGALSFVLGAAALTLLLNAARIRWAWWPLPPVGYVLQGGWMMRHMWFGLFIAWIAKVSILRYGGLEKYRQALPFFLGLVIGEFVVAGFWSILAIVWQVPIWSFWS